MAGTGPSTSSKNSGRPCIWSTPRACTGRSAASRTTTGTVGSSWTAFGDTSSPRPGSHRRSSGSCASWWATGPSGEHPHRPQGPGEGRAGQALPQAAGQRPVGGQARTGLPRRAGPPDAYVIRIESLRDLVGTVDREVAMLDRCIHLRLKDDQGYQAIQALDGVGRVIAAVFCAEIGDVGRFTGPKALCSWVGLTPRHRESDTKTWRGKATKQGSRLVRWAAIEAISKMRGGPKLQIDYHRIADRRGKYIARVAVARKLLTPVYFGLRDGEIRALARAEVA